MRGKERVRYTNCKKKGKRRKMEQEEKAKEKEKKRDLDFISIDKTDNFSYARYNSPLCFPLNKNLERISWR